MMSPTNSTNSTYPSSILSHIHSPGDLKALPESALPDLCSELREVITNRTLENGGHLASNLGVVELTVALHRCFSSPDDKIIFDVGHQAYVHKLLTGRQRAFTTLRQPGGLSGFPKRSESPHDAFGVGHSGTSLSAALGFAEANRLEGKKNYTIAVIGDGAFTCGMIHEAMNNCHKDLRLILILNENEMSISKNIGGFASYLAKIRATKRYYKVKRGTKSILSHIPLLGKPLLQGITHIKGSLKNLLYASNMFEELGMYYFGPVDGHDLNQLEAVLEEAKAHGGCCFLHVKTQKGKGYLPAEEKPNLYHGISPHTDPSDLQEENLASAENFSLHMGRYLTEKAKTCPEICAITAAMSHGTGLDPFREAHPDRFFDVGIAEGHAATFAAGLSAAGKLPVFAVYSTFLQRSYDNLLHDFALQSLPGVICVDRAGLAQADGPTHHGIFDVAFCLQIPGAEIYAPLDYAAEESCLDAALLGNSLSFVRYPSGKEDSALSKKLPYICKEAFLRGSVEEAIPDAYILTYGRISAEAMRARELLSSQGIQVQVLVCEHLKPWGSAVKAIREVLSQGKPGSPLLFIEEGIRSGGAGMHFQEALQKEEGCLCRPYKILAIDEQFGIQTKNESIFRTCQIDAETAQAAIQALLSPNKPLL